MFIFLFIRITDNYYFVIQGIGLPCSNIPGPKGVGLSLIKFLEKEARAKNIFHFHIITSKNNEKAKSLYKKLGYSDTGEILLDKTLE